MSDESGTQKTLYKNKHLKMNNQIENVKKQLNNELKSLDKLNDELTKKQTEITNKKESLEILQKQYDDHLNRISSNISGALGKIINKTVREELVSFVKSLYLENCCVCFENTSNKTQCGHLLCLSCLRQLNNKLCPLCRTNL